MSEVPCCPHCGLLIDTHAIDALLSPDDKLKEMVVSCDTCGVILAYRQNTVRLLTEAEKFRALLRFPALARQVEKGRVANLNQCRHGEVIDWRDAQ